MYANAYAWAHSTPAIKVANCESGDRNTWDHYNGNPHIAVGAYRGKWQIGFREWQDAFGTGDPAAATETEQDYRAWILWKARGWQPWSCSGIMGVW